MICVTVVFSSDTRIDLSSCLIDSALVGFFPWGEGGKFDPTPHSQNQGVPNRCSLPIACTPLRKKNVSPSHILAYCTQPMDIAALCNFVTFHWTNASGCWSFEGNFNSLIVITWELTGSLPFCLMPKCKLISWLHSQKMMKCEHLKYNHRLWIYRTANYSIIWEK